MDVMEDVSKHAQGIKVFYEAGRRYDDILTWTRPYSSVISLTVMQSNNLFFENYGVQQLQYITAISLLFSQKKMLN
jgi:hypothetical protein